MLSHTRHGERVQGLEEERGESPDEHRGQIGVKASSDRSRSHICLVSVVACWWRLAVETH
jgi:hypothetical protein